jgi:hypothetical protein
VSREPRWVHCLGCGISMLSTGTTCRDCLYGRVLLVGLFAAVAMLAAIAAYGRWS